MMIMYMYAVRTARCVAFRPGFRLFDLFSHPTPKCYLMSGVEKREKIKRREEPTLSFSNSSRKTVEIKKSCSVSPQLLSDISSLLAVRLSRNVQLP